jgi:hypothetical protein
MAARGAAWRPAMPARGVLARLDALWPGLVPCEALSQVAALWPAPAERRIHGRTVRSQGNMAGGTGRVCLHLPGLKARWRLLRRAALSNRDGVERRYGPAPSVLGAPRHLRRVTEAIR